MKKKINIVPYDSKWPDIFKAHSNELKETLKENCIQVYHVGSTSVPGLCAKPVVDIMCVVKNLKTVSKRLELVGYESKGEFNLPLRLFFNKKKPNDINLHVVNKNNGEIEWNLIFRDHLRKNKEARNLYAQTKLALLKENPNGFNIVRNLFSEYTIKKGEVIRKIAERAGFNGYRFVIANNYNEVDSYKDLMNLKEIDLDSKNVFHLCLYKGTKIAAAACVEFDILNSIVIINSAKSTNSEKEKILKDKINEWAIFHDLMLTR